MDKKNLKIVFMGTPDFAVESLRILVENEYNIAGVVTMPDKPAGRGHKIQYSAVKKYALEHNLPLLQPEKLKDESFIASLKSWNADLQIVVAFRMLPEVVWNMPPKGTFNLHASLLPQYRGAAPINWAVINGDTETGVTTFFLTHEIDTGKIIQQEKVSITETDNAGIIHDKLMNTGAKLVKRTVDLIIEDKVEAISQEQLDKDGAILKPAPKIFKETCRIDWKQSAKTIYNFVRGLAPYPTAWTTLKIGEETIQPVKIYSAEIIEKSHSFSTGYIETDNKTYLNIACADGYLSINEMQLPGKKAMKTDELLRGFKFSDNSIFE
ncbi:methionyl-tRNA formyltransferase [Dysgonomonas sp. 216]|uniref:methionyl-tRNA formyltransferase n=1 Tax=Dysgonomonas sp. 216 TaxID=2302934 RepID=UPI0013D2B0E6|nr:methionyl-tRNA formyltransferase [Dysgonomonas sp. 216]NDW17879.1 methionyl-tRNA formyltransferase [Dysgonomonas sp. 216]